MWKTEAYRLLASELASYEQLPYQQLAELAGESREHTARDESGTIYTISVTVAWRDDSQHDLEVKGLITNADSGPFRKLEGTIIKSQ